MIHGKYGRVLGMILAGGKGERLMPLTRYRAKPAVPFAAKYRIIDFALSNMVNSGLFSIYCLIQFKSQSLHEHIGKGWQFGDALRGRDFFINVVPAQMWDGERWYEGTADAIFQNMHLVTLFDADRVCIFAADHIYKMDVEQMLAYHMDNNADVTVAAYVVPSSEASQFGCIATDETGRIIDFVEASARTASTTSAATYCRASSARTSSWPTTSRPTCCPATTSPTGRTSEASRPTGRRTWTFCATSRRFRSTTRSGR